MAAMEYQEYSLDAAVPTRLKVLWGSVWCRPRNPPTLLSPMGIRMIDMHRRSSGTQILNPAYADATALLLNRSTNKSAIVITRARRNHGWVNQKNGVMNSV